jgi:hypothetical protein
MISPTVILQDHINLTKRDTREMINNGGLDCVTRGVLGLMESAGSGDMKAVDLVINRLDGLLSEKVAVRPVVVEIIDYGTSD